MKVKAEKIVVVSANHKIKSETRIINDILEAGADYFHFRKYGYPSYRIAKMINEIPEKFHSRIILHSHYPLAKKYHLGGIHIPRKIRKNWFFNAFILNSYKKNDRYIITTSYHSTRKIERSPDYYSYFFLNNIFGNLRGTNKHAYKDHEKLMDFLKITLKDIVPLGGIDVGKIPSLKEIGFKSVGIHGYLWGAKDPVKRFVDFRDAWLKN